MVYVFYFNFIYIFEKKLNMKITKSIILIILSLIFFTKYLFADTKSEVTKVIDTLITHAKKMNFEGFDKELDQNLLSKMNLKFANKSYEPREMIWYEGRNVVVSYTPETRGLFFILVEETRKSFREKNILNDLETASPGFKNKSEKLPSLLFTKKMFPPNIYKLKYMDAKDGKISFFLDLFDNKPSLLNRFLTDLTHDILKFYPEIDLEKILNNYNFKSVDKNNFRYLHYTDNTEVNVTRIKNKILITSNNLNIENFKKFFSNFNKNSSINNIVPLLPQPDKRYEFVKLKSKKNGSVSIKIDVRGEDINLRTLNSRLLSGIRIVFRD